MGSLLSQKIILSTLVILSLIFFLNIISAKDLSFSSNDLFTQLGITKGSEDNAMTVLEKYNDVLYPPESELRKQGLNLRTYKQLLKRKAPINRNSSVTNIWGTAPLTGTIHIPVLLVQFTDNLSTQTQSAINESFNSSNYLNGQGISVSKYYTKQSYGDLNIIYDVYDWRTAPQTYSWYSLNSSRNFQLVLDSINLFNSTTGGSNVNFSQYDNDNDGRIDGFVIIYPGVGGIAPTAVWPHTRILKQYTQNIVDGKYLGNVALVPEKGVRQSNQFEISVTTHEFAHVLGLPDLYAIGPQGQIDNGPLSGMSMMMFEEVYCLNKPINLDVWSRYFLGWVAPIELTTDSNKEISLRSINDYPDAVILRNSNMGAREYFIIENRYRNHSDSSNLDNCMFINAPTTYGGFAIYHVDENKIEFDYPNNWVNWDRDNNYFNDTVSWPGVLYEENTINSTSILIFPNDLYFDDIINSCDSFKYFDENQYLCAPYGILDRTTSTYSGVQNPKIRFTAISSSNQSIMTAKMLVGEETATPVTSPSSAQVYYVPTQITLSTSTPGATIYYTTNGSTPTTSSSIYTTPITAPANAVTTIKAIAKKNNFYVSDVMTSVYTVTGTVATPTANQVSGVIDYNSQVILSTATSGATIRYTLDNSEPTESSSIYSTAINIFQTTNIKAKAYKTGYEPSATATYNYQVLVVNNPISTLQSGYYNYGTITEAYTTTAGATIRYTINGTTPNEFSTIYAAPIMIDHNFTLNLIAYKTGYAPSQVVTYNYTTGNAPQNLILSFTFQEVESQTVINNDYNIINIIIPYGVNRSGLTPIIIVEEGCTVYPESGISQSFINSVNYTVSSVTGTRNYTVTVTNSPAVYPPEASIDGGNYSQPITVELMTETEGAIIKYTLDGSIPNLRTSQTYTSPITISSSKTLKAKAYLYVGPTFGSPLDNRGTASVKSLSDLLEATIIWESSELMTENYTITRKNNNKVKAEKKLIPTQEMNK